MLRKNLTALFLIAISMATTAHASADDVKCDEMAKKLSDHYTKDYLKYFHKELGPDPGFIAGMAKECEKAKLRANSDFKDGTYNIRNMSVEAESAYQVWVKTSNPYLKDLGVQYYTVAFMYGYVNWFVN